MKSHQVFLLNSIDPTGKYILTTFGAYWYHEYLKIGWQHNVVEPDHPAKIGWLAFTGTNLGRDHPYIDEPYGVLNVLTTGRESAPERAAVYTQAIDALITYCRDKQIGYGKIDPASVESKLAGLLDELTKGGVR